MSMTDPIADMLARIRNAVQARHDKVVMPASKIKAEIAAALAQEGYVRDFKVIKDDKQGLIRIRLKYKGDTPAIRGLSRVSRPGMRVYASASDIQPILNGAGSAIISTSRGIMTDQEAREANVGGEVLLNVW